MTSKNCIFRNANIEDLIWVHQTIQETTIFQLKSPIGLKQTLEDLIRDAGLTGESKLCDIYILELENQKYDTNRIGYAVCYIFYSSWIGKTYFIDNIYTKPEYQKTDIEYHFLCEITQKAKEIGCKRLSINISQLNSRRELYENSGMQDNTLLEGRRIYIVEEDKLDELKKQIEIQNQ